jgi:putative Holliday junction resolvase
MVQIHSSKPKPTRILGIDFGLTRIGLALSDERKVIAGALVTFTAERRSEQTVAKLVSFIAELEDTRQCTIEDIVIGLPLMMSGKSGFLADEVQHFVQLLGQSTSIPIHTWDERLSTVQADRSLKEIQLTRKRRSKIVDQVSAVIILQSYLDSKNPSGFPIF